MFTDVNSSTQANDSMPPRTMTFNYDFSMSVYDSFVTHFNAFMIQNLKWKALSVNYASAITMKLYEMIHKHNPREWLKGIKPNTPWYKSDK